MKLDPLSSEAMYLKHKAAVDKYHEELKKKKKKKKGDEQVIFHKGKFVVTYEWNEADTLTQQ